MMRKDVALGIPAVEDPGVSSAECPLCHTPRPTIGGDAMTATESWECPRCQARWSAARLATAAAYARYNG